MAGLCHDKLNAASTAALYDPRWEIWAMIDNFALALSHGLMLLAAWRLLSRGDLDDDGAAPPEPPVPAGRPSLRKASPGA